MVTGAGSGIGRAVSLALAQAGAEVILLGRTVRKLEGVHAEIQKLGGPEASIVPLAEFGSLVRRTESVNATIETPSRSAVSTYRRVSTTRELDSEIEGPVLPRTVPVISTV